MDIRRSLASRASTGPEAGGRTGPARIWWSMAEKPTPILAALARFLGYCERLKTRTEGLRSRTMKQAPCPRCPKVARRGAADPASPRIWRQRALLAEERKILEQKGSGCNTPNASARAISWKRLWWSCRELARNLYAAVHPFFHRWRLSHTCHQIADCC